MSSKENRFGLSRYVPTSVRRQLRQEAGFGCVICGLAIGQYEHIEPEFKDAKEHNPSKMAFLCLRCHGKVTLGHLSKATVFQAKEAPKAKSSGFSFEAFDSPVDHPTIVVGTMRTLDCETIIEVDGEAVLWITRPELKGQPFGVNAIVKNQQGDELVRIQENEWRVNNLNWDVEVIGNRILVKESKDQTVLELEVSPPSTFIIKKLKLNTNGIKFHSDNSSSYIEANGRRENVPGPMTVSGSSSALVVGTGFLAIGVSPAKVQFGSWN